MKNKKGKRAYRAKKRKPFFIKAPFLFSVLMFFAFCGGIFFAFFAPQVQIKEIKVAGTKKIDANDLSALLDSYADTKMAFGVSKSIILYNLDAAKADLLTRFPQIASIKIKRQFPSTIYAAVQERAQAASFNAGGSWYAIDDLGVVFEKTSDCGGFIEIRKDGDFSRINLGAELVNKGLLQKILIFKAGVEAGGEISIPEAYIASADRVDFKTNFDWDIYVNPKKDLEWQISKFRAVASDPDFLAIKNNLSYVDLRFSRVYVKQKQQQTQQTLTEVGDSLPK